MPVENTFGLIANLNPSWPQDTAVKSEGDNHIREIKQCLQGQFPALSGVVFATDAELNYLQGVTGNIQGQLDAVAFPVGTKLIFVQAAPPTGWTLDADLNDRVIRINSASGGLLGGGWQITGLTLGSHTHDIDLVTGISNGPNSSAGSSSENYSHWDHTHNVQGATQTNTAANINSDGTWRPAYVDVIVASKD